MIKKNYNFIKKKSIYFLIGGVVLVAITAIFLTRDMAEASDPPNWLPGYSYCKDGSVNATVAGAQTNYQLKLIVGESSGASGANVHCENHCEDFPNDIRFTKEDGITKHNYWIETDSISGVAPNRKVTVWIEVISTPASGSVAFYMYYGKSSDSGESSGSSTHLFFDDFLNAGEHGWDKNIGAAAEHPIIKDDTLYFAGNGIWILELDGTEKYHYLSGKDMYCAPVVIGDYVYTWEHISGGGTNCNRLHKTKISDGTDSEISGNRIDFEGLTTTNVGGVDLIFIPKGNYVTAIRADTLATYWTSTVEVTRALGHWDGGLVLGNYLYTRQMKAGDHKLCKLNLSNGTIADSVALEDENHYARLLYDADHNQIIVTEKNTMKIKAFDKDDFTLNWSHTLDETTGWYIMYGCSYHNNKIYIADKKDDRNRSYIYCLNATTGSQIWKSSAPYNEQVVVTNHILGDNYLFCPTHDYYDDNYYKMMVIDISDGSLHDTIQQSSNSACSRPVISNGIIYLGMWSDYNINARGLGEGNKLDCPWGCDAAHTGYAGNRLTSYSPDSDYNLTDQWTNSGNYELIDNTLKKYAANTNTRYDIISKTTYTQPVAIETRTKVGSDWNNEHGWNFAVSWDSGWATLGYLSGHYKDDSNDYYRMFRWDGGATDSNQTNESIVADTWYNLSLLVGSSNQYYKVDGVQKVSLSTSPPTNSTNIIFSTGRPDANADYTTYFDWVFARKYSSPEPTWGTWGGEISSPPAPERRIIIIQ